MAILILDPARQSYPNCLLKLLKGNYGVYKVQLINAQGLAQTIEVSEDQTIYDAALES